MNTSTLDKAVSSCAAGAKPVAPAVFHDVQSGFGFTEDIELWNLTEDIEGHCKDSTVSRQTLERAGFFVPEVAR